MGQVGDEALWLHFVRRHTKPGNLAVHFVSALGFFVAPLIALATWNPWWVLPFFASGLIGAAGHYLFDDGGVDQREATRAPEVPQFVLVMFWMLATGTWWPEVERARRHFETTTRTGEAD